MGGTSAAFFLRQLYGPKVTIDVFEAGKVGGRIANIKVNGQEFEAGGTIIHRKNKYMLELAKKFNASKSCLQKIQLLVPNFYYYKSSSHVASK